MSSSSSSSGSPSPPPSPPKRKRHESDEIDEDISDSDQSGAEQTEEDEPVLSHAAQRKQKKAAKLAAKKLKEGDNAPVSKKQKLENGSAAPAPANKRQNSVWVGNMSYKTTQADLKKFFADAGEVVRFYMPTKPPPNPSMKPENRGFAYVDFATPEGKLAAIALSEQPLTGRKLLIKDGDDFSGRPTPAKTENAEDQTTPATSSTTHSKTAQKVLKLQKQPPAPTLFIGNLGFEATEDNIRELFEAHKGKEKETGKKFTEDAEDKPSTKGGWIRKIRMGTFEDSGKCKGWAFADFTSIEDATSVLVNPKNHYLNGRKLVIEYASPDAVRRGQPREKKHDGQIRPPRKEHVSSFRDQEPRERKKPVKAAPQAEDIIMDDEEPQKDPEPVEEHREWKPRPRQGVAGRGGRGFKSRQRPGAALAHATRQSAAIVESQGKKITF